MFYKYFATNHTCACSVISTSQLFTSRVYRQRTKFYDTDCTEF